MMRKKREKDRAEFNFATYVCTHVCVCVISITNANNFDCREGETDSTH